MQNLDIGDFVIYTGEPKFTILIVNHVKQEHISATVVQCSVGKLGTKIFMPINLVNKITDLEQIKELTLKHKLWLLQES